MKTKHIVIAVITFLVSICIVAAGLMLYGYNNVDRQIQEQLRLGQKYLSEMKYEEAIVAFHKAITLDPKNTEAYLNLADAYAANGRLEEALKVLENAPTDIADSDEIEAKLEKIQKLVYEQQQENVEEDSAAIANAEGNPDERLISEDAETEETQKLMNVETSTATEKHVSGAASWKEAGLEDHPMNWKDEALGSRMREITLIRSRRIRLSDVWWRVDLDLSSFDRGDKIETIDALAELTNLTKLQLQWNNIKDITALSNMTDLENLNLLSNQIVDITPLSSLTSLRELSLKGNQISDITPLSNLTSLTQLVLDENEIVDITPLSNLTSLTHLDLDDNPISDITPLSNLKNLQYLSLSNTNVTDLSPLASLPSLVSVDLYGTPVTDYSPLEHIEGRHH